MNLFLRYLLKPQSICMKKYDKKEGVFPKGKAIVQLISLDSIHHYIRVECWNLTSY